MSQLVNKVDVLLVSERNLMILFQRLNFCYMDPRNQIDWTVAQMALQFFFYFKDGMSSRLLTDHRFSDNVAFLPKLT